MARAWGLWAGTLVLDVVFCHGILISQTPTLGRCAPTATTIGWSLTLHGASGVGGGSRSRMVVLLFAVRVDGSMAFRSIAPPAVSRSALHP